MQRRPFVTPTTSPSTGEQPVTTDTTLRRVRDGQHEVRAADGTHLGTVTRERYRGPKGWLATTHRWTTPDGKTDTGWTRRGAIDRLVEHAARTAAMAAHPTAKAA